MTNRQLHFAALFFALSLPILAQPTQWNARGTGGGGAFFSPSINPNNDQDFYVSCDMSNLFHTNNNAAAYDMVHFGDIQAGHNSEVQFSSDPNIRYVLSYDPISSGGFPRKTTNGGLSWTAPIADPTNTGAFYLYANPDNANQVIITDYSTLFFSNNGGSSFNAKYTTANGGAGIHLSGVFWDGNNIYASTNDGLLVSTNGGTTFAIFATSGIPANNAILSFAGAKQGDTTRFFALTASSADVYGGVSTIDYWSMMTGVYALDWGSSTWQARTTGIDMNNDFPVLIRMAKNDINTVYLAGGSNSGNPIVLKTSNAGASWSPVFLTNNNQNIQTGACGFQGDFSWTWNEVFLGLAVAPNNANKIVVTDYGFVHLSNDGGNNWQQAYTNAANQHLAANPTPKYQPYQSIGIENTTCWQIFWIDNSQMWACYSDVKGNRSTDGGAQWSYNYTGHTENTSYRMVKNIGNTTLYMATASVHDLYESTRLADAQLDAAGNTGAVKFSTNNGQTWQLLHDFSDIVCWVAIDPNNANRLYASVVNSTASIGGVWTSANIQNGAASTWTKLPNPPRTEGHPFNIIVLNDGKVLCSYSGHRDPGFTASSGVFLYDPPTNTWADRSHSGMYYWTKDVIIDPFDATQNTWYACVYSGWGGAANGLGGLYKTTDRGQTWTRINALDRIGSATINPQNTNEMYLCTETEGLWYTNNRNVAIPSFTQVSSYPFRQPERVFFNPYNNNEVWVANFGNSIRMGNASACIQPTPVITASTGNASVCQQTGITYTVPLIANHTYFWGLSGNGTIVSGQNTNQIVVQWNSGTIGTVSVTETAP